jgi:hypothetical protein
VFGPFRIPRQIMRNRSSSNHLHYLLVFQNVLLHVLKTIVIICCVPRLDSFAYSAPNQYIYNIVAHFKGLYAVIIGGSLVFHLIYGALLGFISGRMTEIGAILNTNKITQ